jgi:hypothetical protein
LVLKYSSKRTYDIFASGTSSIEKVNKFDVQKIFRDGDKIIAKVFLTDFNGRRKESNFIFIKENNTWKFDLQATFEYELSLKNKKLQEFQKKSNSGLPDFIVTDIKIYPEHPIVNSEDVEIEVYIKNIGDQIAEKGLPYLNVQLLGFDNLPLRQGGILYPILPQETAIWTFKPYSLNNVLKISDVAGKKTVKVMLNPYQDIQESNYNNNIFIKEIEVYNK